MNILMVAAENGALPGGKVGGMGDVIRDVPRALAEAGHRVTVITPSYGRFHENPRARYRGALAVPFRGGSEDVAVYALPAAGPRRRVLTLLLEHPLFASCGAGRVYCNDPPAEPFATDSSKFALFSAAAASGLQEGFLGDQDIIHLHDWHAATVAVLARLHPRYGALRQYRLVFTIHNLALQGIRPTADHSASLTAWFPDLVPTPALLDTRYPDCYNPMRAAIMLCDRIHAVSPTYAEEICDPVSTHGEGLHAELAAARRDGRLQGILNGCEYPRRLPRPLPRNDFLDLASEELTRWIGAQRDVRSTHLLARERIDRERRGETRPPTRLLTFVGRLTDQKFGLLSRRLADGETALHHVLESLKGDEQLLVLGSGDEALEQLLTVEQARDERLLFLCGFSERLSEQLYAAGDLFLMPSRFEPCGIAQMLAMRAGQPCLVNRTGGLADTVIDGTDGFVFAGDTEDARIDAMLTRLRFVLERLRKDPQELAPVRTAARAARFPWNAVAEAYTKRLYRPTGA